MMSEATFPDWSPARSGRYIKFALVVDELRGKIDEDDPLQQIVDLIRQGDLYALDGATSKDFYNQYLLYELAAASLLDPYIQLELGCLLMRRAAIEEPPLCAHMYERQSFENWHPATDIHRDLLEGPISPEAAEVAHIALDSYSNAWDYFRYREGFVQSLFALDGIRVAFGVLEDTSRCWDVCQVFEQWLDYCGYKIGDFDGDYDIIVRDLEKGFAETRGRLRPIMRGRPEARKRLQHELPWFDLIRPAVADYLIDAEYQTSNLQDPSYNPKGAVACYCMTVEAALREKIGAVVDTYLETAPQDEVTEFQRNIKRKAAVQLTLGQFAYALREPSFKRMITKAGLDSSFYFTELPQLLDPLADDYRNPASHADPKSFNQQHLATVRGAVLEILARISRLKLVLSEGPS